MGPGGELGVGRPIPGGWPRERGKVGSSAVLAGPCAWRGLFHRRRRRPIPHRGCPAAVLGAVPGAVLGVVLGAVQGAGLVLGAASEAGISSHSSALPTGGPFPCLVCWSNARAFGDAVLDHLLPGGAGLDRLILALLGGAGLDRQSHARLGVRGAACHPVEGGRGGWGGLLAVRGLAPPWVEGGFGQGTALVVAQCLQEGAMQAVLCRTCSQAEVQIKSGGLRGAPPPIAPSSPPPNCAVR